MSQQIAKSVYMSALCLKKVKCGWISRLGRLCNFTRLGSFDGNASYPLIGVQVEFDASQVWNWSALISILVDGVQV